MTATRTPTVLNSLVHSIASAKQDSLETEKPALVSSARKLYESVLKVVFIIVAVKPQLVFQGILVLTSSLQLKQFSFTLHIMNIC